VLPDGDLGDDDLTADGKIEDLGGPGLAWPVGGVTVPVHANTLFAPRVRLVALVIALLTAIGVVLGSGLVKR
jgi:hypothetical protein